MTKEIWELLEVAHEGTSQVKKSKISLLIHKFKCLKQTKMGPLLLCITNCFNDYIVGLKGLGKVI